MSSGLFQGSPRHDSRRVSVSLSPYELPTFCRTVAGQSSASRHVQESCFNDAVGFPHLLIPLYTTGWGCQVPTHKMWCVPHHRPEEVFECR